MQRFDVTCRYVRAFDIVLLAVVLSTAIMVGYGSLATLI